MQEPMSTREVLELPAVVNLPTAGRAFGLGRDTAYRLYQSGEFPAEVLRLGRQLMVRRADLLDALGIEDVTAA